MTARLLQYVSKHQKDWDIYVQPVAYVYSAQMHRSTNLTSLSLVLSCLYPGPTNFTNLKALLTDATATTSEDSLNPRLLHGVTAMSQEEDSRMKSLHGRYKDNDDLKVFNAALLFNGRQYFYIDYPQMTTATANPLATESYNRLLSVKAGPFMVIKVWRTVMIH